MLSNTIWSLIPGGITAPSGFQAAAVKAGFKASKNLDLALILGPGGTICAGCFTKSLVRAGCVDLCVERIASRLGRVRGVLINSGQANACTGERGLIDSQIATKSLANLLSISEEEILICSTGVIGEIIPMDQMLVSLEPLVGSLGSKEGLKAAKAILTTDLVHKQIAIEGYIGGKLIRIGGMAKGSGMIHPDMATMLAFLSCDAGVSFDLWNPMIKRVVNNSFNSITVDGDTSTNDSVLAFSSGDVMPKTYLRQLEEGLNIVAQYLAKAIVRDGEGANCLIEVQVKGTFTNEQARYMARKIASSSLVKTALHGCDPNWGRIIAAAARSGVPLEEQQISLSIGPYQVVDKGVPLTFKKEDISNYMRDRMNGSYLEDDCILINLSVGDKGSGYGVAWGCDLSREYVSINADYTT